MMDRATALDIARRYGIDLTTDFHALSSDQVELILLAARERKYTKPANANGSKARYFHAYLVRAARDKPFSGFVQTRR